MITKELARTLQYRQELWHTSKKNGDGTPVRCRVNGKMRTWKTRPGDWQLPVKHGLKECFYITPENADEWQLPHYE